MNAKCAMMIMLSLTDVEQHVDHLWRDCTLRHPQARVIREHDIVGVVKESHIFSVLCHRQLIKLDVRTEVANPLSGSAL